MSAPDPRSREPDPASVDPDRASVEPDRAFVDPDTTPTERVSAGRPSATSGPSAAGPDPTLPSGGAPGTARAVGRVLLLGVAIGLLALVGAASGAAAAWAVPIGLAVSVLGRPPVAPRGLTAVVGGVLALVVVDLGARVGGPQVAAALTVAVLVVAAGLLRLRDDPRAPGWAVLLGGATVLAGAQVAEASGLAEVAPALGGLVAGLLPMQVAEVVRALRGRGTAAASPTGTDAR